MGRVADQRHSPQRMAVMIRDFLVPAK